MKIELKKIKIRDIINGYQNNNEERVVAYSGMLDIRPKYQREFVYKEKQRNVVIETINKGFPLNVMYWVKINDNKKLPPKPKLFEDLLKKSANIKPKKKEQK